MGGFVGRTVELRELRARVERAPVTLVLGRGGIGKTATVREAMRGRRALEIGVRPGDDRRQVLVAIGRALAKDVVVPTSLGDVDALGEAVARGAEHVGRAIIIDDVHHLAAADARALIACTLAVARRSRYVFVARALPKSKGWAKLIFELDDLDPRALARMARALAPASSRREVAAVVEAAQGSPWLLLRCLATRGDRAPDPREIAAALPKRAAPLLRLLASLHLPIDAATARALLGGPLPRGPEGELGGARVRAHDALRDALAASGTDSELPRRLGAAAVARGDGAAALEAARLHLERDDATEAAAILEPTFDAIVDAGLAPRLHVLLGASTAAPLSELRLRAAIALGAGPSLDEVLADPRPQGERARVRHGEALLLAGRATEARALLEREPPSPEARRILARALLTLGALGEAEELLAPLRLAGDPLAAALTAKLCAARGELVRAVAIADELGATVGSLRSTLRREVQHARLAVYSGAGHLKQVRVAALSLLGTPSALASFREGQVATAALSLVEIEGGNVAEGRRLLGMLGPYAERAPNLRFFRRMNQIRIFTIEGDFPAATAEAEGVLADARVAKNRDHERWALVARSMMRLLQASDVGTPEALLDEAPGGNDPQAQFLRAFRWMRSLRVGIALPDAERPTSGGSDAAIDAEIYALQAQATEAFTRSSWDDAEGRIRRAVALAEENGYAAHALEARLLLFDVLFVARQRGAALGLAREIANAAKALASRRFELETELAQTLFAPRPPIRVLERLALEDATAPAAARRARSLLGLPGGGDRIDERVVAATPWHGAVRTVRGGTGPSWGIDLDDHRIWFPDGRSRAFVPRALHGPIASALVRSDGACSKEELAQAVWNVREYHPLRDDKRIQVAIMRFRRAVEDGQRPRRILSTPLGYAVGADEPMRIVCAR